MQPAHVGARTLAARPATPPPGASAETPRNALITNGITPQVELTSTRLLSIACRSAITPWITPTRPQKNPQN